MQPVYCQDKNRRYPIPDLVIFFAQSDTSRPVFLHCHMKTKLGSCCFGFLLLIVIRLFTTLPIIVVEKKLGLHTSPFFKEYTFDLVFGHHTPLKQILLFDVFFLTHYW